MNENVMQYNSSLNQAAQNWIGDIQYSNTPIYPAHNPYPVYYYYPASISPIICSGNCHVFNCLHCNKCQCGKAVKSEK
jgi:hypothetical protein